MIWPEDSIPSHVAFFSAVMHIQDLEVEFRKLDREGAAIKKKAVKVTEGCVLPLKKLKNICVCFCSFVKATLSNYYGNYIIYH